MESNNKVILYTIGCPKCKVIEKKLNVAKIEYEICDDMNKMLELGFQTAPVLDVDGKIMNFTEAVAWINECRRGG